jgi:predicted RNA-binding Zn ribbon-like protein
METVETFPSILGNAALDFANTSIAAAREPSGDVLASVDRFVAWARHVGVVTPLVTSGGTDALAPAPEERSFLHVATRLRSALIDIASALVARREPDPAAITELQTRYVEAIGHARGTTGPDRDNTLTWSWADRPPAEHALWKLTDIAVELFRHGALDRLKACDDCRFIYLDASKNNSRRWCSMDGCGKTAKMRRYVERRAARRADTGGLPGPSAGTSSDRGADREPAAPPD